MKDQGYRFPKGNQINKGHIPWNKGIRSISILEKRCEKCSKMYSRKADSGNNDWLSQRYCSKSCASKGNKRNLGKKRSIATRKKMSAASLRGPKSPYWIKDRTQLKRYGDLAKDRRCYAYIDWRNQIYKRDDYNCRIANGKCEGRIEAHHILSFTHYPELRYQLNNGITLCRAHHPRVRAEEKRLVPYFTELVSVSK